MKRAERALVVPVSALASGGGTPAAVVPAASLPVANSPATPMALAASDTPIPPAAVSLQQNPYLQAYLAKSVQVNPYLPVYPRVTQPVAVATAPVAPTFVVPAPQAFPAPAWPAASVALPQISLAQPGTVSEASVPFPPVQLPFPTLTPVPVAVPVAASPTQPAVAAAASWGGLGNLFNGLKLSLPELPLGEQSILPKIQTVYPTGEKPLVVVTFKCPTELIGVDTPSTLILHKLVNGTMDLLNRSNLLSFNLQQVCA